ncbi:MAG: hypothetical protein GQ470_05735 [Gammaproteobacteria bacterium]|nr:hypothetical protein [Gammaproteobacteria bacterium]
MGQVRHTSQVAILVAAMTATPLMADETLDQLLDGFDQPAEVVDPLSDDPNGLNGLMSGFDEVSSPTPSAGAIKNVEPSPLELFGSLSLKGEYGYAHDAPAAGDPDYRGLSHLKFGVDLGFDYRINPRWKAHGEAKARYDAGYRLNGRDEFSPTLLDDEEKELEIGELWVRGELADSVDIKVGRQIVVWGKSDNLSVTNILNPIDNRSTGMVDVKDLRLPLMMAKLDYYFAGLGGNWGVSAIAIPEISFNKNPLFGSEYYPYPVPQADEVVPEDGPDNIEYALAINGIFSGWDLSLYRAQLFDDNPYFTTEDGTPQLLHSRIQMSGVAANSVKGSWLFKGEMAHLSNLRYSNTLSAYRRLDMLLGVEYAGVKNTALSLELVHRQITDHDSTLQTSGVDESAQQLALSIRNDQMHDRLHLTGLVLLNDISTDNGGILRLSGEYELNDSLAVTLGIVDYISSSTLPFSGIEDNDRLFTEIEYQF